MILCIIMIIYQKYDIGVDKKALKERTLRITVPEDLNYSHMFDDLFEKYTDTSEEVSVKTSNMGSLFKLTFRIEMKDESIVLMDSQGKEIISYTPGKNYNSVVISCPEIVEGETYTLMVGGTTTEVDMESLIYGNGMGTGGFGGFRGNKKM